MKWFLFFYLIFLLEPRCFAINSRDCEIAFVLTGRHLNDEEIRAVNRLYSRIDQENWINSASARADIEQLIQVLLRLHPEGKNYKENNLVLIGKLLDYYDNYMNETQQVDFAQSNAHTIAKIVRGLKNNDLNNEFGHTIGSLMNIVIKRYQSILKKLRSENPSKSIEMMKEIQTQNSNARQLISQEISQNFEFNEYRGYLDEVLSQLIFFAKNVKAGELQNQAWQTLDSVLVGTDIHGSVTQRWADYIYEEIYQDYTLNDELRVKAFQLLKSFQQRNPDALSHLNQFESSQNLLEAADHSSISQMPLRLMSPLDRLTEGFVQRNYPELSDTEQHNIFQLIKDNDRKIPDTLREDYINNRAQLQDLKTLDYELVRLGFVSEGNEETKVWVNSKMNTKIEYQFLVREEEARVATDAELDSLKKVLLGENISINLGSLRKGDPPSPATIIPLKNLE